MPGRIAPLAVLIPLLAVVFSEPARAQSGIQITPDARRVLVSKDVGAERWALTRNSEDGTVTGNVFFSDGSLPQFIACEEVGREGETLRLRCEASLQCPLLPCLVTEWKSLGEVTLPVSFFERDEVAPGSATGAAIGTGNLTGRIAQSSNVPAGVQLTPDRKSTLINKDVSDQRWAITLNGDDSTVTGNVFFPDGSDPAFLWCGREGQDDVDVILDCFGADRCTAGGCQPGDWTSLFEVRVPESFFQPPENVSTFEFERALIASLGEEGGFDALLLALSRGYSLRQAARGGLSGRITPPGEILKANGEVELPEGQPLDSSASVSGVGSVAQFSPNVLAEIRRQILAQNGNASPLAALVVLLERYGSKRVMEAMQEGRLGLEGSFDELGEGAFVIVDENGRPVSPNPISKLDPFSIPEVRVAACGNGILDPGEACDPDVQEFRDCSNFGLDGNDAACHEMLCRWDTRPCSKCGNGVREAGLEECDGTDIRGLTCRAFDEAHETTAVPGCTEECKLDLTPCASAAPGGCPDGRLQEGEDCDGAVFRTDKGRECGLVDPNLFGLLGCDVRACKYDLSPCFTLQDGCGDGNLDDGEQCDGSAFRLRDCADLSQRWGSGRLRCRAFSCTYDTSLCVPAPSDGPTPSASPTPGDPTPTPESTPEPTPEETPEATPTPECEGTLCPDGTCYEDPDLVCCDEGFVCESGDVCVNGGCCAASFPFLCPDDECVASPDDCAEPDPTPTPEPECDGTVCGGECYQGQNLVCCDDGGACPFTMVCVEGGCCGQGSKLCGSAGCAPMVADCCGDGTWCAGGSTCGEKETGDGLECCGNTGSICGITQESQPIAEREQPLD